MLRLGDFERGLQLYDKYLSPDNFRHNDPFTPLAQRSVAGRKILVRTENGLGTVFLFLRYVVALVEAGAKVVLETPAKLVRLLRNNLNGVEVIREMLFRITIRNG